MIVENSEHLFCCHLFQVDVPCLFDETVIEVMWGLKNLMHILVPQENVKLAEEDCLPMCQGIKIFLHRHGFDVKPEMVSSQVAIMSDMEGFMALCHFLLHYYPIVCAVCT